MTYWITKESYRCKNTPLAVSLCVYFCTLCLVAVYCWNLVAFFFYFFVLSSCFLTLSVLLSLSRSHSLSSSLAPPPPPRLQLLLVNIAFTVIYPPHFANNKKYKTLFVTRLFQSAGFSLKMQPRLLLLPIFSHGSTTSIVSS